VGYTAPSTTVAVSSLAGAVIVRSSRADLLATVYQSSAADLNVTVAGYSTTVNVSSVAGVVAVSPVSTASVRVHQSTAADLHATIHQGSTAFTVQVSTGAVSVSTGSITIHQGSTNFSVQVSTGAVSVSTGSITIHQGSTNFSVQVSTGAVSVSTGSVTVHQGSTNFSVQSRMHTSSGGAIEGSTATPSTNVIGLHVRQVMPGRQSTSILVNIGSAGGSTSLVSSAAGVLTRVYAFSVMSTVVAISSCAFLSGSNERWGLILGSGSSGITGANLAVPPPGSLFETAVATALNFSASSSGLYRVSISYWQEP